MDSTFFFAAICLVPLGAGLMAALAVWGLRRLSMSLRGVRSEIKIEGATCLKADDGSVLIKPPPGCYRVGALVGAGMGMMCVSAFVLFLIWAALTGKAPLGDTLGISATAIVFGGMLGGPLLFVLARAPRKTSIRVNAETRTLDVTSGTETRQIPFSRISQIAMIAWPGLSDMDFRAVEIAAVLSDGEKIVFGSVTGTARSTHTRATTITQWITDIAGVTAGTIDSLYPTGTESV